MDGALVAIVGFPLPPQSSLSHEVWSYRYIYIYTLKSRKIRKNIEKFPAGLPGYPRGLPRAMGKFRFLLFFEEFISFDKYSWISMVVAIVVVVIIALIIIIIAVMR